MSHLDIECGGAGAGPGHGATTDDEVEEVGSACFTDADDGSCYSQFYSTGEGEASYEDYSFACTFEVNDVPEQASVFRHPASPAISDVSVVIMENVVDEIKANLGKVIEKERDCRICQLSLSDSNGGDSENGNGVAIELGCSCKGDLAVAHKNCAEAWFKIKGNKTCEICNSIAHNIVGPIDVEQMQQTNEMHALAIDVAVVPVPSMSESRTCLNGHRFLNFLLACMVFAFVISWLFHFNIPS